MFAVLGLDLNRNREDVDRIAQVWLRPHLEIEFTEQWIGSFALESPFLLNRVKIGDARVAGRRRTRSAHHEHDVAFFRFVFGAEDVWARASRDTNNQVARLPREPRAKEDAPKGGARMTVRPKRIDRIVLQVYTAGKIRRIFSGERPENAGNVKAFPAFVEKGADSVPEKIIHRLSRLRLSARLGELQFGAARITALKLTETRDDFGRLGNRAVSAWPDETGRRRANAFDRFAAERCFFDVDAGS